MLNQHQLLRINVATSQSLVGTHDIDISKPSIVINHLQCHASHELSTQTLNATLNANVKHTAYKYTAYKYTAAYTIRGTTCVGVNRAMTWPQYRQQRIAEHVGLKNQNQNVRSESTETHIPAPKATRTAHASQSSPKARLGLQPASHARFIQSRNSTDSTTQLAELIDLPALPERFPAQFLLGSRNLTLTLENGRRYAFGFASSNDRPICQDLRLVRHSRIEVRSCHLSLNPRIGRPKELVFAVSLSRRHPKFIDPSGPKRTSLTARGSSPFPRFTPKVRRYESL